LPAANGGKFRFGKQSRLAMGRDDLDHGKHYLIMALLESRK
jgi:hypothetical protein